ncbi:Methionyl-tRNA formyltransferase [hydrothermal vent metagenome]|uniref:methionyl-tRNA formyltransferase n=1 Tax=hydrothermal vent metagenome TaxID=652676 RepID=A0A3B1DPI3_9ZZZZ
MKIIFFGSDDFAATHLEKLIPSPYEVMACITQPDRPKNRGMKVIMSSIKILAQENNIPVFQPDNIKCTEFIEQLNQLQADLFVVIAYGRILPAEVLDIPKLYAINVHGSLLPKYRGAAPINWAMINGDTETGLTIIQMNTGMDSGNILAAKKIAILPEDNSAILRIRMMQEGAKFLLETIDNIVGVPLAGVQQDKSQITYAPKLNKKLGYIDWHKSAEEIHNLVRGLQPWPGAYIFYKDKQLKIFSTAIIPHDDHSAKLGEVIEINKQGFVVVAGKNVLLVKDVQLSGSKRMDAASFVRGHQLEVGFQFRI